MGAGLRGVDVLESQRAFREVRRVGITADAVVKILRQAVEIFRRVAAHDVVPVRVVAQLAEQRDGVEIRPPLAHAHARQRADPAAAADEPVAQAVGVFVEDDRGIEVAVARRRGAGENVHLHAARRAVAGHGKVRVVHARAVLRIGLHGIVAQAAVPEIVVLEIARRLVETERVEFVVHPVAPVEKLRHRRVAIRARLLREIEREVENPVRRTLRARQVGHVVGVEIEVRVHIVAARFIHAVVDPAVR